MTANVISLNIQPGIQRDGTQFDSPMYVDGQWVRFQRGRPRKIGGYNAIFQNAPEISRGMTMQSQNGLNYVYSGGANYLEAWQTDNDDSFGYGPTAITVNNFTANANNLWQFDIGYNANGTGALQVIAHPGQNLNDIDSTTNTPVLSGTFPYGSLSQVGVFSNTGTLTGTTFVIPSGDYRIAVGQTVTGASLGAGTTVTFSSVSGGTTTVTLSAGGGSGSQTLTFNNNISVSGGACMLYPYLFVYGNNGLIQNNSAGDFTNWVGPDANSNNVSSTKVVRGMPLRGGTTAPAGLFWSLDQLTRVTYNPTTVGTSTLYWRYDIISTQTSILSANSPIEYDGIYYWIGVDRFLMYNGVVQEIPNTVNQNYFFDNINYKYRNKVWAMKIPRWGEIWWFYPAGSSTECNNAIIYNVREKSWYDAGFAPGSARSAGVFSEVFRFPIMADSNYSGYTAISIAGIITGGTNYALNDTVTVIGGTGTPAVLQVSSITGGGIVNGLTVVSGGSYTSSLTGVLSTIAKSPSTGTGLTVSLTFSQAYNIWQHEVGVDAIQGTNVDAVNSYFETNSIGWVRGGPGQATVTGPNKWIRLERIEPDFVQSGNMNVVITGKGYAEDTDITSAPYSFSPTTLKIDMKEQRREMRLNFSSNVAGGNYYMGNVLLSADLGDERGTGNP